ncbi:hypothetical protein, partial [Burkholderia cepacia]|uniref:hypothetical protein n=1 Tax=Burkholderia cepacia TaxID=292 RepID=UPI002ABD14F9
MNSLNRGGAGGRAGIGIGWVPIVGRRARLAPYVEPTTLLGQTVIPRRDGRHEAISSGLHTKLNFVQVAGFPREFSESSHIPTI